MMTTNSMLNSYSRLFQYLIFVFGLFWSCSFSYSQDIIGQWNGKIILPNGSLSLVFHITKTANEYSATLDSPDQGVTGIATASTTFENSVLTIDIPAIQASYKGEVNVDGKIQGIFTQGMPLPLNLEKGEFTQNRPQEPKAPFPYLIEDVQFRNKAAGITLAGTLTLPLKGEKHPVVVLVTGSGGHNRDEELMGHKPFWVIADYLTRKGIAVLRYDDRGIGQSEGDFKAAITTDFATDAEAALDYLKTRKEIDASKMGLLGHSEGGTVAFILAAKNQDVAYVVSMAGTGIKGDSIILKQAELLMKANGMSDLAWKEQEPVLQNRYALLTQNKNREDIRKELYEEVTKTIPTRMLEDENTKRQIDAEIEAMTSPWYIEFLKYDPTSDLKQITCPVFAINGERDIQVTAEMNLSAIESAIKSNGNKNIEVKKYPGLNHLFQHCETCLITEYSQIEETISPEVLQDMADWLLRVVNR